jgi:hypothetical protein
MAVARKGPKVPRAKLYLTTHGIMIPPILHEKFITALPVALITVQYSSAVNW